MIKPGFLDGVTSIDELIRENTHTLRELRAILDREEERETRTVYFTYPNDGTLATLQAGTTTFDFKVGTIEDVDEVITRMSHSLQSEGRDWLRSFFVNSDKSITVQPDGYDRIPATEEKDALGTYQEFTKLQIICVEETKVFVVCCTSPEAVVRLISNTSVLTDPIDVFGHRTYIGAGELAARLGSINTFERRGNIVWMDNFESSTPKWETDFSGTGASALRSVISAKTDNYSMKLTTGDAENDYAKIIHYNFFPVSMRFGIEISFALDNNIKYLRLWSQSYDGDYEITPQILYYPYTNLLCIRDENYDLVTVISDLKLHRNDLFYHTLKLVFDIPSHKYIRAFCDKYEYDISDYQYRHLPSGTTPLLSIRVDIVNNSGGNHYTYVDNCILTQNEPLV